MNIQIPTEATQAVNVARELISELVGIYLFGSAVDGGLRANSDVDVLVITAQRLSAEIRKKLVVRLMDISGKVGNPDSVRPLEFTVVNLADVVPWHYPPRNEFVYGEWLREKFENHYVPGPEADPDLAIVLTKVRQNSIPICGPEARQLLDPVPEKDIHLDIKESLPTLIEGLEADERNVLLTLSRMWITAATGRIVPKDTAAAWATGKLPESLRPVLDMARRAYLGEARDKWDSRGNEVTLLVKHMKQSIEACLEQNNSGEP